MLAWTRFGAGIGVLALMLACTTIVPLGLALAAPKDGAVPFPLRIAAFLAPFDALAAFTMWTWPVGHPIAIACAALHVVVTVFAGLLAIVRLRARGFSPLDELAIDVGLGLVPVGGVWLFATRAGIALGGFHEPVVFFTAAHFHYAGFAAPIVLGGLGRVLFAGRSDPRGFALLAYGAAAVTVCAGVPLTALGIATNHAVEAASAGALACGMLVAGALLAFVGSRVAWRKGTTRARVAAVILPFSGLALGLSMTLAAAFALTSSAGRGSTLQGAVPVQTMIDLHGGTNAIVFALGGLVALTLLDPPPRAELTPPRLRTRPR